MEPQLPYISIDTTFVLYTSILRNWPNAEKKAGYGYKGNGLILVRKTETEFHCYDATCTRDINNHTTELVLENGGLGATFATCPNPKCKTQYNLKSSAYSIDGKCRLQEYRATYNPITNIVRITN